MCVNNLLMNQFFNTEVRRSVGGLHLQCVNTKSKKSYFSIWEHQEDTYKEIYLILTTTKN